MSQGRENCKQRGCKATFELIPPDTEHIYPSKIKDDTSEPKYHRCDSKEHHINLVYWSKNPVVVGVVREQS